MKQRVNSTSGMHIRPIKGQHLVIIYLYMHMYYIYIYIYTLYIQGVTNKFRQNLSVCIKTLNKHFFTNNCPKMPRYRDIDTQILDKFNNL